MLNEERIALRRSFTSKSLNAFEVFVEQYGRSIDEALLILINAHSSLALFT